MMSIFCYFLYYSMIKQFSFRGPISLSIYISLSTEVETFNLKVQ